MTRAREWIDEQVTPATPPADEYKITISELRALAKNVKSVDPHLQRIEEHFAQAKKSFEASRLQLRQLDDEMRDELNREASAKRAVDKEQFERKCLEREAQLTEREQEVIKRESAAAAKHQEAEAAKSDYVSRLQKMRALRTRRECAVRIRERGIIRNFDWRTAWGFVVTQAGDRDVWVHTKDVVDGSILRKGSRIEFEVEHWPNGKRSARHVRVIG